VPLGERRAPAGGAARKFTMIRDLRSFTQILYECRWRYALGALALAFSDGGQLFIAHLIGRAFDALRAGQGGVGQFAAGIAGCALLIVVSRFAWRQLVFGTSRHIERRLRQRLFDHLIALSPRFYLEHKVGELMAYATNDISAIQVAAAGGMMAALDAAIQFVGAGAMMFFTVNLRLGLIALVPLVLLTPATYWLGRRLHASYGQVQESFAALSDRVQESIAGIRVVKGFAREPHEQGRFDAANQLYYRHFARMLRYDAAFDPMIGLLAGVSFTIGLAFGGRLVILGKLSLGQYVAFNTYLMMLVWPMLALGWVMNLFQRAAASGKRLEALFAVEPEIRDRPDAVPLPDPRGHIRATGLTFRYAPDLAPALTDIHLDIPPGHTVGIIGRTGSGKSTLAQLLVRTFDPPPGQLFLDGHDVADIRLADLRQAIAFVPQDTFLFSRSIAENIAFDPTAHSDAEIVAAARIADIDRDIQGFPRAYETPVGERGITLSGGQRQRVGLARAILRQAPVLVLDDCLSAVDTATEARILTALREFTRDLTTLIVSHRVSAVRHADEIVVLSEGRIAERGTHEDLVAAGGEYARLFRRQQLEAAIEGTE
jgi:ATP-binding cassette, subfamily B, multidrug efflux pump